MWLKPDSTEVRSSRTDVHPPSSHGPLDQWLDPQNAYADDNLPASTGSLIGTREQHWGGFHLAEQIPRGARILGITVTVDTGNLGVLAVRGGALRAGGKSHTLALRLGSCIIAPTAAGRRARQAGAQLDE